MSQENFVCIALLTAKKGCEEQLRSALCALIEPTRQEEGCIVYELNEEINNAGSFTMVEKFINQAAFEFHGQQPYLQSFRKNAKDFIETKNSLHYKVIG